MWVTEQTGVMASVVRRHQIHARQGHGLPSLSPCPRSSSVQPTGTCWRRAISWVVLVVLHNSICVVEWWIDCLKSVWLCCAVAVWAAPTNAERTSDTKQCYNQHVMQLFVICNPFGFFASVHSAFVFWKASITVRFYTSAVGIADRHQGYRPRSLGWLHCWLRPYTVSRQRLTQFFIRPWPTIVQTFTKIHCFYFVYRGQMSSVA